MAQALEKTGSGTHHCRHVEADAQATKNNSYAAPVNSIHQLIEKTKSHLNEKGKVEGQDYDVLCQSCVRLQLTHSYESRQLDSRCTRWLDYTYKITSQCARSDHHDTHWCVVFKYNWWYNQVVERKLLLNAVESEAELSTIHPSLALRFYGQGNKTGILVAAMFPSRINPTNMVEQLPMLIWRLLQQTTTFVQKILRHLLPIYSGLQQVWWLSL